MFWGGTVIFKKQIDIADDAQVTVHVSNFGITRSFLEKVLLRIEFKLPPQNVNAVS